MIRSIRECIYDAIKSFLPLNKSIESSDILVERPKNEAFGELYTNAAMVYAKRLGMKPHDLAEKICATLRLQPDITETSVAGNGFVNFKLRSEAWQSVIPEIIKQNKNYSYSNIYNGLPVNLEFVSANPTGPLHTGHARNAVFGSVVANLLERIGYKVTKEFYINDQGNQIKFLAKSVYLRYCEELGQSISENDFTSDMYCGEYIKDLAKELAKEHGDKFLDKEESEWIEFFCKYSLNKMLDNIKKDLELLGVVMDKYSSEAELCVHTVHHYRLCR